MYPQTARENDIRHLDRNLEALIQELAERCQQIFFHASGATSRSAHVAPETEVDISQMQGEKHVLQSPCAFPFRERITLGEVGVRDSIQRVVTDRPRMGNGFNT